MDISASPPREVDPLLAPCSNVERKQSPPFNYWTLFALLCAGLIKPICFDIIFPFINQMILENNIVSSPEDVGFYSGSVESLFAIFGLLSIMPWTYASDYFGRKPIILYGRLGMGLSMALFGMSRTYWMMIVTRCVCGIFGGTQATVKVMVAEVYPDKSNRISAFSALQISIRVGQVAGQSIGGWLSHPDRNIAIFDASFWREYPFSLPCFVAGTMGLLSWLYGTVALRETLPSRQEPRLSGCGSRLESSYARKAGYGTLRSSMTPQVNSMLTSTFIMTFVSETFYALYPLFAFTPRDLGGLGFSEAQIGTHMAIRAFVIVCIIMLSAPLQHRLGPLRTYQLGMSTWPLTVVFLPILSRMANSENYGSGHPCFWLVFTAFYLIWGVGSLVWPCIQILAVNASPTDVELATVSGLSQICQSLGEALAPAFITSLFAYSVEHDLLGGNLTYAVLLVIGSVGFVHALTLKEGEDFARKSNQNPNIRND